jgi:hypothetical protein
MTHSCLVFQIPIRDAAIEKSTVMWQHRLCTACIYYGTAGFHCISISGSVQSHTYTVSLPTQQEKGHRLLLCIIVFTLWINPEDLKHKLSSDGIRSLKVKMGLLYGLYAQLEVKMRLFLRSMRRKYGSVIWTVCSM